MNLRPISAILAVFLSISCSNLYTFYEYEHISSIPNGRPFNNLKETSVDLLFSGLRYRENGWVIDGGIGVQTSSGLQGRDPFGRIRVGREHCLK